MKKETKRIEFRIVSPQAENSTCAVVSTFFNTQRMVQEYVLNAYFNR